MERSLEKLLWGKGVGRERTGFPDNIGKGAPASALIPEAFPLVSRNPDSRVRWAGIPGSNQEDGWVITLQVQTRCV